NTAPPRRQDTAHPAAGARRTGPARARGGSARATAIPESGGNGRTALRAPCATVLAAAAGGWGNGHGFHQYSGTIMGSPVAAPAGLRGCRVALYPDPPASISASCDGPPAANGGKTMAIDLGQRPTSDLCQHPAWQSLAGSQPGRRQAWRCILDEAVPPDQLAEIRRYPAAATGTGSRCLQSAGRSEDPTLRFCQTCPSTVQKSGRR